MTVAGYGRNDPCHCGSGKKYKRCCLDKDDGYVPPEITPQPPANTERHGNAFNRFKDWASGKVIQTEAQLQERIAKRVATMGLNRLAGTMIDLIRVRGKAAVRAALMDGMPRDFWEDASQLRALGKETVTADDLIAPYKAEPKVQELMDKLEVTWEEMTAMAEEALK